MSTQNPLKIVSEEPLPLSIVSEESAPEPPPPPRGKSLFERVSDVFAMPGVNRRLAAPSGVVPELSRGIIPAREITRPLVEAGSLKVPGAVRGLPPTEAGPTGAAIAHGLAGTVEDLSSPAALALMMAIGPLTSPGLEMFGFINSIGLTGDMAVKAYKRWQAAKELEKKGKSTEALAEKTAAITDAVSATLPMIHQVRGRPATSADIADQYRRGLLSPHVDAESIEAIATSVKNRPELTQDHKGYLLSLTEERLSQLRRPQAPVASLPVQSEPTSATPLPQNLPGPAEAPRAPTVRSQMRVPGQVPLTIVSEEPLTKTPLPAVGEAVEPQHSAVTESTTPPSVYEESIQKPTSAIERALPIHPAPTERAPLPVQQPLPETPPKAHIDYDAPILGKQRKAIFAIAGDKELPKESIEQLAGKRVSHLTVGEAQSLMDRMNRLTPEEAQALKPKATTPLLDRVEGASEETSAQTRGTPFLLGDKVKTSKGQGIIVRVGNNPDGSRAYTVRIKNNFEIMGDSDVSPLPKRTGANFGPDPDRSLQDAVLFYGGIDPDVIKRLGHESEWRDIPLATRQRISRRGTKVIIEEVAQYVREHGYPVADYPDLLYQLRDPKIAKRGLVKAEPSEYDQLLAEYERLSREYHDLKSLVEEPGGWEPEEAGWKSESGFARVFDFPESDRERAKLLLRRANILLSDIDRIPPGEKREFLYSQADELTKKARSIAGVGPWEFMDEEGFARIRDEKTKELFEPGEFLLTGAAVKHEELPRALPKTGELKPPPQQPSLLQGPLFEVENLPAKTAEAPQPATLAASARTEIEKLKAGIADGETRLRSGVNALGEKLTLGEVAATRHAVNFARQKIEKLEAIEAERQGPFTAQDIARFNRLTHFPKDLAQENARYNAATAQERQAAVDRLRRYGINEMPEDVENALDRLRSARLNMAREFTRAREIAPPWTVTGRANYSKFAKPERAHAIEDKALSEYETAKEYLNRAIGRHSPNAPISSDKAEAPDLLQDRIARAEGLQETMRQANAIIRKKGLTDEQKIEQMSALGIGKAQATELLKPDFAGRTGFADYELRNNLANIARMRGRISSIEQTRAKPGGETPFAGGRIVDNADDNRIQLFFDAKPEPAMIANLKSRGFRWSPTNGAWQRQRTDNARYAVVNVLGDKLPEGERGKFLGTQARGPVEEPAEIEAAGRDIADVIMRGPIEGEPEVPKAESGITEAVMPKPEKPAPVSTVAESIAQTEVNRRAQFVREVIDRVINGKGTWGEKRKQLGLSAGKYAGEPLYLDIPISKPEIENLIRREMADTVHQIGIEPTNPAGPAKRTPTRRSLFGDDEGFFKFRSRPGVDDDPVMKQIFDRLERAEKNSHRAPLDILPRPGEEDVPGSHLHGVSWIRSADQALARQPETAPVAIEIKYAARDKKRAMQHYDDLANDFVRKNFIKKNSEEDRMVKDLLDEAYTGLTPENLLQSPAYRGNKKAAIFAARRLRDEIFEPIINQICGDPELIEIIGKKGYIRGYFPHYMEQMKEKYGREYLGMARAMLPERFVSRFLKEREAEAWANNVSIYDVVPAYINSTMRTIHDIPAYNRANKIIKTLPEGPARDFAQWYADNYMDQPTAKEGLMARNQKYQRFSRWLVNRYYDNLIGLNYGTWAVNLGQTLTNTYPELGAKYTARGIRELFTGEGRRKFHDSGLLFDYPGMESGILDEGLKRKVLHGGMAAGEYINRGIAYLGGLEQAKDMGLVGRAAEMHAMDVVDGTQFAYGKESGIRYLENLPPDLRVFQTFPLKEAEFVRNLVSDAMKGGPVERAKLTRFLMINAVLPAALAVAGVPVGKMFIDVFDVLPKPFRTFQLQAKMMDWLYRVRDGRVPPEKIPLDIVMGLYNAFGPAANIGRQVGRETGLIEDTRKTKGAK